ncbi:FG-GAP-like repeat-containing protein [Thiohalobacter sp. IOR34]|uniref:FG-GAP-like repeat-containing protein n=1 Tax=Thiohalobacter sp. IOR34 TaxID=3057176 RepID=UPI0025B08AA7|nr:FG-GAP-like repeat-containing protein [Thiohalobacter sp. IOR34]WJW76302.1 FG-GAP-like repeat-containing protein [Thiohalobacter sp. IOR34]
MRKIMNKNRRYAIHHLLVLAWAMLTGATFWHESAVSAVMFTDVTLAAGIDYQQHQLPDPSPSFHQADYMSGAAAAGDYDNDGWVDLYVTRLDGPDLLYRNQGDGTFVDVAAAVGITRGNGSNGAAWADIDNDGDLDLYVTSLSDKRFYLYINDGKGGFTEEAAARGASIGGTDEHYGFSVTFGDYDGDGYLDIHTTEWRTDDLNPGAAASNSRLLRNQGSSRPGYFDDVTLSAGVSVDAVPGTAAGTFSLASRFADLDQDGFQDLLITGDFGTSRLFWNNGDGTFTDGTQAANVGTDENGMGSALADFDGDGRIDWFVASIYDPENTCATASCTWRGSGNRLFRNNGDRTFTDVTDSAGVRDGSWGWGASFIDYDNDGDQDLVLTNGMNFPNEATYTLDDPFENDVMRFWENDGAGVFTEKAALVGLTDTASGKGLLTFDYDKDGDLDIFVVNNGGRPVLYRNDGGNANDWLRIECAGHRTCIGVRVKVRVEPTSPEQVFEFNAGSNYLGQNEMVAHFGVGSGSRAIDQVQVVWPGGALQTMTRIPRNSTLKIIFPVVLNGGAGTDVLFGKGGYDTLTGGAGNDALFGNAGNDLLAGGEGDDMLNAGSGDDQLEGGAGNDHLAAGDGDDILNGGAGDDSLFGEAGDDILVLDGTDGNSGGDFYDGGIGVDTLRLTLTATQYADPVVQAELNAFVEFLAINSNSAVASNPEFTFFTLGLTVRNFELIEVNGVILQGDKPTIYIDPTAPPGGDGSFLKPFDSWASVTWDAKRYLQKVGTESKGGKVYVSAQGTASSPVEIGSYGVRENGVGNPIISGGIIFENASYVVLDGLTIRDGGEGSVVIRNGSHHITIKNSEIRESDIGVWITSGAGTGNVITGNLIHSNAIDGVAVNLVNAVAGDESYISNNVISYNGVHGIELTGNYYIVEGNEVLENGFGLTGTSGIHLLAESRTQDAANHNIIRYNVVYNTHEVLGPDGNGIQLDRYSDFNNVYGNISFNNGGPGMNALRSSDNTFYENVLFANMKSNAHAQFARPAEFGIWAYNLELDGQSKNNTVMNNIIVPTRDNTYAILIDAPTIFFEQIIQGNRYYKAGGGDWFLWGFDVGLQWGGGESGADIDRWNQLKQNGTPDFFGGINLVEADGQLIGGPGIDILHGGAGDDSLYGDTGDDILVAREGDDFLSGGPGKDRMVGGPGNDVYDIDDADDRIYEFVGGGTDEVRSSVDYYMASNIENLVLTGNANIVGVGNELNNTLIGNSGANMLVGDDGADFMLGGDGSDYLRGDSGNDYLDGGAGNDLIFGGEGVDVMKGGPGEDVFVFRRGDGGAVLDFEGNQALGGDLLLFDGFGAGAMLSYTGSGGIWRIDYVVAGVPKTQTITLVGIVGLHPVDYKFQ